jgi:hypothetical protein
VLTRPEFGAAGRYEVLPPIHIELLDQWIRILPFGQWGEVAGWFGLACICVLVTVAISQWQKLNWRGFAVFGYLVPASLMLYVVARAVPLRLFIPGRYVEYSFNILLCIFLAACLRLVVERLRLAQYFFPGLFALLVLLGGVRLHGTELFDYSANADLYAFVKSRTSADALVAGPPDLMDNVMTFGHRRAFITEELSHPWIEPYWSTIKKRTYDFFGAYYSDSEELVRIFCRQNGISYIVVREADFSENRRRYFEPFGSYISEFARPGKKFALLNSDVFPDVFRADGIRVIKIDSSHPAAPPEPAP